jgi:hypothetical protein
MMQLNRGTERHLTDADGCTPALGLIGGSRKLSAAAARSFSISIFRA